jgi:very-short-patch-repair endonuclease
LKNPKFHWYHPSLKEYARQLRLNSTLSEKILWNELKSKKFLGLDFHRQKPIDYYILDFFCPVLNLGIELDGATHLQQAVQIKDLKKEGELNKLGISIIRFEDREVLTDIHNVLRTLEIFIESIHNENF